MPTLFLFAFFLMIRVLTLGTPDPINHPDWNINTGLGYMWNPMIEYLKKGKTWIAAAGQIFFTLSLGIGVLQSYASYLKEKEDIVVAGLATASTNEFAEVILGGTIAIPAAVAFFGPVLVKTGGAFDLGFKTLPLVFGKLPYGWLFSTLWFLLLFLAGVTSGVALSQPLVAFLEDEFGLTKKKAALIVAIVLFTLGQPIIFLLKYGVLDDIDWWIGTVGLALFATLEVFIFNFAFGTERGWQELHRGASMRLPRIFYFIMRYITPFFLLAIFIYWIATDGINFLLMKGVPAANRPFLIATRIAIILVYVAIAVLIRIAWDKKKNVGK